MASVIQSVEIVSDEMAAILQQKTEAERLAIAWGMWNMARNMIRAVVAQEHPAWSEEEIQRQVARRLSHGSV